MKTCWQCKKVKPKSDFHKHKGRSDGLQSVCKTCRLIYDDETKNHPKRIEWREKAKENKRVIPLYRAKALLNFARRRSIKRNEKCSLSIDYIYILLMIGRCARTGIEFSYDEPPEGMNVHPYAPSIDRIDRSKGYINSNIQLVVWIYNSGKGERSDEEFIEFCKIVAERYK
jgi:hypothetical protein